MFLLAALLCNYGRGKCLIDIGTEGFRARDAVSFADHVGQEVLLVKLDGHA